MDDKRFDDIAKHLARTPSRRSLLKIAAGAAIGAFSSAFGFNSSLAAALRGPGTICRKHGDCDSNFCGPADFTGRRRCECNAPLVTCGTKCVNPATGFLTDKNNCGACGTKCSGSTSVCCNGACVTPASVCNGTCCSGSSICFENACCTPQSVLTTCGQSCGPQTNNCGQTVDCGICCTSNGASCASSGQCCSGVCDSGVCCTNTEGDCLSNEDCCSGACVDGSCASEVGSNGASCDDGQDCTSGICCDGTCVAVTAFDSDVDNCGSCGTVCSGTSTECATVACTSGVCGYDYADSGDVCVSVGYCDGAGNCVECTLDDHCPSGTCENTNLCCVPDSEEVTCTGECGSVLNNCGQSVECDICCILDGEDCDNNDDCCSSVCVDGVCLEGPQVDGSTCFEDDDCQSAICCDEICVSDDAFDTDVDNCGSCGHVCSESTSQCTENTCTAGVCGVGNLEPDTVCTEGGGSFCDGAGLCVECNSNEQCDSNSCEANVCCIEDESSVTCDSLCGPQTNNCGNTVQCDACCVPDSDEVTCTGECGSVLNNCGTSVDCGACCPSGTQPSSIGDYCVPTAAACATAIATTDHRYADLRECDFSGKSLISHTFQYANLTGTKFNNASIIACNFQFAILNLAVFTGATLTANAWYSNTCPDGTVTNSGCCSYMNGNNPTSCS